jgi:hypothetical protein
MIAACLCLLYSVDGCRKFSAPILVTNPEGKGLTLASRAETGATQVKIFKIEHAICRKRLLVFFLHSKAQRGK